VAERRPATPLVVDAIGRSAHENFKRSATAQVVDDPIDTALKGSGILYVGTRHYSVAATGFVARHCEREQGAEEGAGRARTQSTLGATHTPHT